jgi:hypothetical protein
MSDKVVRIRADDLELLLDAATEVVHQRVEEEQPKWSSIHRLSRATGNATLTLQIASERK